MLDLRFGTEGLLACCGFMMPCSLVGNTSVSEEHSPHPQSRSEFEPPRKYRHYVPPKRLPDWRRNARKTLAPLLAFTWQQRMLAQVCAQSNHEPFVGTSEGWRHAS